MHFVDRKPKGEQPRLLTPHPDTSILYDQCQDGGTCRRKGLKIPRPYGCTSSILVPGTTKKQTGYDTNPHPFPPHRKPPHACSCNCKCKQEGASLLPSLLPLPTSIRPAALAAQVCFPPYFVGWKRSLPVRSWRASRASGGHPESLSLSAG